MRTNSIIIGAAVSLALLSAAVVVWGGPHISSRQATIHEHSADVMPFDLEKTLHVFKTTESGGVQAVTVRDPSDTENLALIRMHLKMEAESFANGDFSDPARLHGADMPGIVVLQKNYEKMKVTYRELSNGAEITYESSDAETVSAIHQWFDAQVKDHGRDAVAQ
jgi:hypothetical protein